MSEYYYAHNNDQDGATRAHRVRYHIARGFVEPRDVVLDASCGCGYGSEMLGEVSLCVLGVDQHEALISHANSEHSNANVKFAIHDFNKEELYDTFDVAVSLETIEHLQNPEHLVETLKQATKWIIVSVPHIDSVGINMFHFHDYSPNEIRDMFIDDHWMEWHSITQGAHGMYFFRRI